MRLSSLHSSFVFNLPSMFVKPEVNESYMPLLQSMHVQYDSVIDYLNSTIKSVTYPGLSYTPVTQTRQHGKIFYIKPAKNVFDLVTTNEISVVFRSVDSDINYWMMVDLFSKHYIDTNNMYIDPFKLSCVDMFRNEIYSIVLHDVLFTSISDNPFEYNNYKMTDKEFTAVFNFNYIDIEYTLDKHKVMEQKYVNQIITRK